MPTLLATGGTVLVLRVLDQPSADTPPHFSYPLTAVMLLYAAGVKTREISLSSLLMRLHSRIGVLIADLKIGGLDSGELGGRGGR